MKFVYWTTSGYRTGLVAVEGHNDFHRHLEATNKQREIVDVQCIHRFGDQTIGGADSWAIRDQTAKLKADFFRRYRKRGQVRCETDQST